MNSINGAEIQISKPRSEKEKKDNNWVDWTDSEKLRVYEWLKKFKLKILKDGILCFDDAYMLGDIFFEHTPKIKILLQKRFRFVFVDEMQDMEKHQHDLLEKIFYDDGNSPSIYQRVGDKNQAIFDGSGNHDEIWSPRTKTLVLEGSHRLSQPIAELVNSFALHRAQGFRVVGRRDGNIKPYLIVYENGSVAKVIPKFAEIIVSLIKNGVIEQNEKNVFKAIAWRKDPPGEKKIGLPDYFPDFNAERYKPRIDHSCLSDYLSFDDSRNDFQHIRKNIINALLRILRYEEAKLPETERDFTENSLFKYLRDNDSNDYETIKLHIYHWSLGIIRCEKEAVLKEIESYIPTFLKIFGKVIKDSNDFISQVSENNAIAQPDKLKQSANMYEYKIGETDLKIHITTVHAEKGQDHTATLYLETYFYKDGTDAKAKSYESQRLSNQFKLTYLTGKENGRTKQSAKMAYVGSSRPTHLLCIAVQKNNFDQYLNDIDRDKKWTIEYI